MKINVLVQKDSWIMPYALKLKTFLDGSGHIVRLITDHNKILAADVTVILSYQKILPKHILNLSKHNIVVHESALPQGKGWSPLTWQILEGKNEIPVALFEASEKVDAGPIYYTGTIKLDGTELLKDIRKKQGKETVRLVKKFLTDYPCVSGTPQHGKESFYSRRRPEDSELDIDATLREQFNLLRAVDNKRYPAFFYHLGKKYIIKIYEGR